MPSDNNAWWTGMVCDDTGDVICAKDWPTEAKARAYCTGVLHGYGVPDSDWTIAVEGSTVCFTAPADWFEPDA